MLAVFVGADWPPVAPPLPWALSGQSLHSRYLSGSDPVHQCPQCDVLAFYLDAESTQPRHSAQCRAHARTKSILKTRHYFSCYQEVGLITRELDKKKKNAVSGFLKVMTQLKQLVTKQVDKSLAISISVCFVGGGGGSIVEADFGLHWLALLPSGLSQMSSPHPYKIQPLPGPPWTFSS